MNPWDFLAGIVIETLRTTAEAGPFVLLGLVVAGLLHEFLDTSRIVKALGRRDFGSILAATFLGAPLPLCSCGVLPAAVSLRKKGASREATVAFLISTPETGVDSIALTYGLLGPFMAIARPLAATVTSIVAGALSLFRPEPSGELARSAEPEPHEHVHPGGSEGAERHPKAMLSRLQAAVHYGFGTLLDSLAFWLAFGFLVTGILVAALPPDFFQRFLPGGLLSLVVMAALAVPTYVCASASTPVAAAMVAKGLNPGAALVFMLTGPATNPSTVAVVARLFGRRFLITYLGAIFGVAIAAGALVNALFGPGWAPPLATAIAGGESVSWYQTLAGMGLIVLMGRSLVRTGLRPGLEELRGHIKALASWAKATDWQSVRWRRVVLGSVALTLALYLGQGFVVVRPGEEGLVRVFGRVASTRLPPGLHFCWPSPVGRVELVATGAVRTVEIGYMAQAERGVAPRVPRSFPTLAPAFGGPQTTRIPEGSLFVAGDETLMSVTAIIQYQVADAARFQLGSSRPDAILRAIARAALVEAIGRTPIDALYSNARGGVEAAVLSRLRGSATADAMGIRPISVSLLYVHAPDEVHAAFRDVASAAEDRTTIRNKALVEAEGSVRLARGGAARLVSEAESYRVQQVEHAHGNAAAFVPLAAEDRRASAITRDRLYLEAMERVLARVPKLIKPDARRAPGLELWVTPADGESPSAQSASQASRAVPGPSADE